MTKFSPKLSFENWEFLFGNYSTEELLKLQRKINKEVLRRIQIEEDR